VIQPLGWGTQIDLDVTQRLALGQLSEGYGQKLVHTGEVLDLVIATVSGHASTKSAQGQKCHELRENKLPWFMVALCVTTQKTISHGIEVQVQTRLKFQKTIVNH